MNMADRRHIRVAESLAHMAGLFFAREAANPSVSGLITVTRAELTDDFKNAAVFLSVLPHTKEEEALKLAKRARSDFRDYVKKHSRLNPVPTIDFELDYGEKNRQRVDELTRRNKW
ncbi:MAG: Ribosome-binding factor A [Candidatus Kaiserbacteria bacterium GW2011_GWA2_58_9]|uniref:Ribosome-binding factor A n=2 Tax=Candidatus Kaiseribacteriota TaxID=1752734 RepID=A0A0G2B014_9BACT|nr:MAG: Ribosome-binding factor A [Candidatus Kaiserbacteria bacterium GW2011_GWA2_58_9]